MFTIEVEKREKDEKFKFEDLEMFHQDCYGGKINKKFIEVEINPEKKESSLLEIECVCCRQKIWIPENSIIEIVKTAKDGQERKIKGYKGKIYSVPVTRLILGMAREFFIERLFGTEIEVIVIQKPKQEVK